MSDPAPGATAAAPVAVVGGGWAGCAAAVTLAAAGIPVTLFEQARTLGGRARRVILDHLALDNGQHLLVGAYRQTFELLSIVHGADRVAPLFTRIPLTLRHFGTPRADAVELEAWHAPAPLHLAGATLFARGLGFAERFDLINDYRRLAQRGFQCAASQTVDACFAKTPPRAFAALWAPLCLAALNTPPQYASGSVFAEVLREAFTGSRRNSDFLVPAVDLSASFPDAAARYVTAHGGAVCQGEGIRAVAQDGDRVTLSVGARNEDFASAIVAVGPHQLAATLGPETAGADPWRERLAMVDAFTYESITTIYLAYAGPVAFAAPMLRLDDAPGHWIFDRTAALTKDAIPNAAGLVAVVISAGGPHDHQDHATLARDVEAQLARLASGRLPPVVWSRVIAERRATYACTPGLARPSSGRVSGSVYLAGDYTDPNFPPTLEAATRSGVAAASALFADRRASIR